MYFSSDKYFLNYTILHLTWFCKKNQIDALNLKCSIIEAQVGTPRIMYVSFTTHLLSFISYSFYMKLVSTGIHGWNDRLTLKELQVSCYFQFSSIKIRHTLNTYELRFPPTFVTIKIKFHWPHCYWLNW